jgi:ribose transport system substrate-binding protein
MKKLGLVLLLVCLAAALFAGGGGQKKGQYEIAYSTKTITNDDFQKAIADSIEKAVKDAGCKFTIVLAGDQTAVGAQVSQVEDLINKKVSAIILNPMDANAVVPVLKKAKAANIPVILVDQTVAPGNDDLFITYLGTDNFNAGKIGGQELAKALGGQGNVLIVRGANGSSAGDERVDGFKAGIAGTNIKVVGEQPGNWTNSVAMQVMENMLQGNPKVDGVFTASEVMADGILQALEDAGRKNVKIMAVDGSLAGVEMIEKGEIYGTMAQFPNRMGPKAVELLVGVLNKTIDPASIPKFTDSGTACYTKSNLDLAKQEAF